MKKKDIKVYFGIILFFVFFATYMDKMVYKLKFEEEKKLHFSSRADSRDLRVAVSARIDKLEKIADENYRIFGYGQSSFQNLFDVKNNEVDKKIDSIPDDWYSSKITKAETLHGLKNYELRYQNLSFPTDIETSYVAYRSCEFGTKRSYETSNKVIKYYTHTGLDIANAKNKKIKSVSDGIVTHTGKFEDKTDDYYGGQFIYIQHNNISYRYFHLSEVEVKVGDRIKKGERIGIMGTTGFLSEGEHLHLEFYNTKTNKYINPVINTTWGTPVRDRL
jgi:murein DD-endopeptidase MepM/ murein hydrolase activator NlpD